MNRAPAYLTTLALLALPPALTACGSSPDDSGGDSALAPPDEEDGFQLRYDVEVPAGTEVWKCRISEVPATGFLPVNRAESVQSEGMHHMDIMALAFTGLDFENGDYDCADLYAEHAELMEDGIFLYASQMPSQVIELPEGVVAQLPGGIQVMQEIHYVNTTDQPQNVFSAINVYRYEGAVTDTIWGNAVRDTQLEIPASSEHSEWTRCVMNEPIDLLYLASHTHQLGLEVTIRTFDGTDAGEVIYTNTTWESPKLLSFGTEPLHVPAGSGFEFTCKFRNPSMQTVNWGFDAEDEMCQMAMVFTPGDSSRVCTPVDSSDGRHDLPIPPG